MARDFYPFVERDPSEGQEAPRQCEVKHPARVAVYDDASAAPRVVVIEPKPVRDYLEEITSTVTRLAKEQGGSIPFMVIREIVENFIHAYFKAPTITILDDGNTIRFSDQGPGIKEKDLALEYGTTSATEEMRHYIRGVGSGLPYAQQYMEDKGGSLEIEDNIAGGTVVTISTRRAPDARAVAKATPTQSQQPAPAPATGQPQAPQWQSGAAQPMWGATTVAQPGVMGTPGDQPPYYPWDAQQQWAQQAWQQMTPAAPQPQPQWQAAQPSQPKVPRAQVTSVLPGVTLSDRDRQVLSYLSEHELVGPTDLTMEFGASGPTWSRVLSTLSAQGLVMKRSQKYQLTAIGRALI